MLGWVETGRASTRKMAEEGLTSKLTADYIGPDIRLFGVENHHRGSTPYAMRKRRPGLLVRRFAVHYHRVPTRSTLCSALPHLLTNRAVCLVRVLSMPA